ncbi:hypothetical protein ACN47E_009539 [Coniothyrium glycines]
MSYGDYGSRSYQRSSREAYYTTHREASAHTSPRHQHSYADPRATPSAMRGSVESGSYSSPYNTYDPYEPRTPRRSAAPPQYRSYLRTSTWPPSPSVEDETDPAHGDHEGEPPINTRGAIDQDSILDDIEPPVVSHSHEDRRFVLLSEPNTDDESERGSRRRKSVAERGNLAPIETDMDRIPVIIERVRTPYSSAAPQRESTAPTPNTFPPSPDPTTPSNSNKPRSVPKRETGESDGDQNAKPSGPSSIHRRHDSFSKPRLSPKTDDTFDDSDLDSDQTTYLRTERKPNRYSFVKSDLREDDLRTNLRDTQERPKSRRVSGNTSAPPLGREDSSTSSKENAYSQPPRYSSSAFSGSQASKRIPSRPSSPLPRAPSPNLPARLRESPPSSRPSSQGTARPASPPHFPSTVRSPSPTHGPVLDADWHYSTYPPPIQQDRSYTSSRPGRHETMPNPAPRIDVHSPSPARQPQPQASLPYPVDDIHTGITMPPEQHFQVDHSTVDSPRQMYTDSPRASTSPAPHSPRMRDEQPRLNQQTSTMPEELSRTQKVRSSSFRSTTSENGRRERPSRQNTYPDPDRPLPSCPRTVPSARYQEWHTLRGFESFDICPACYEEVFSDTIFASDFLVRRRDDVPKERHCDFSSAWLRLAWLLTIKQQRKTLNLLYRLLDVVDAERPCPGDREVSSERLPWYGIPDQRDGIHVANFAVCPCDKKMIEVLLPSLSGYFTKLPSTFGSSTPEKHRCSLRTTSRRFPKYLDLLVELDADAQLHNSAPNMNRFVQLARDNAFKGECARDKTLIRKPWHFIPSLPEFTVCEECYDEVVWPALASRSVPSAIPRMMNKAIQLVPGEDHDVGSSCCLYSPRMRRIWDEAVAAEDFRLLERAALERKRAEAKCVLQRRGVLEWMAGVERGGTSWERAKAELRACEREWSRWE